MREDRLRRCLGPSFRDCVVLGQSYSRIGHNLRRVKYAGGTNGRPWLLFSPRLDIDTEKEREEYWKMAGITTDNDRNVPTTGPETLLTKDLGRIPLEKGL
jgi:hypothetical protein